MLCDMCNLHSVYQIFYRVGIKVAKTNNRLILLCSFILAFLGSLLLGDWQAIGQKDPCSSHIAPTFLNASGDVSSDLVSSGLGSANEMSLNVSDTVLHHYWRESCEALSSTSHQCFWNPSSSITGDYCNTCSKVCLSARNSLNFYQFNAGVLLVSLATPLLFVFISAVASDYTAVESQVMKNQNFVYIEFIIFINHAGNSFEFNYWCWSNLSSDISIMV